LTHCTIPPLHENHVCTGTGKACIDGIREWSIKQQSLLGSDRTVNVALKKILELEAVKLGASSLPNGRRV
jgi:hypothetical protein